MKKAVLVLKILFSLLFFALLVFFVDWRSTVRLAADADLFYLGLSVLVSIAMVAASCWKWWFLHRFQGRPVGFLRMFRWYFVGYFYSNLLPSNIGGDVVRVMLAGRACGSRSAALMSVFTERFTGLILLLVTAVVLPLFSPALRSEPAVIAAMAVAAAGLTVIAAAVLAGRGALRAGWVRSIAGAVKRLVRADRPGRAAQIWSAVSERVIRMGERASELIDTFRRRPSGWLTLWSLTLLFYVLMILNVVLAYRTFGVWPPVGEITMVLSAALLLAMMPVTLGNLGIAETSYVFFFGLAGMGADLTLAVGLLLRFKVILLGLAGLYFHLREPAAATPSGDETPVSAI